MAFSSRSLAVFLCVILVSLAFATRDALAARALLQGINNFLIFSISFIAVLFVKKENKPWRISQFRLETGRSI
jgi:hypothetical protein